MIEPEPPNNPKTKPDNKSSSLVSWTAEDFLSRNLPPKEPLIEHLLHLRRPCCAGREAATWKDNILGQLGCCALRSASYYFLGFKVFCGLADVLLF